MIAKEITIQELMPFIEAGFRNDWEILRYFDRTERVESIEQICGNIYRKLANTYPDAKLIGIYKEDEKVGYFAYEGNLLISFAMNKWERKKETSIEMWAMIKKYVGEVFQCVLYTYNTRAIQWLKKNGMKVFCEDVTILTT